MKSRNSNLLNVIKFYLFYVSIVLIATPLGVYLISFLSENYLFGRSVSFEQILKNNVLDDTILILGNLLIILQNVDPMKNKYLVVYLLIIRWYTFLLLFTIIKRKQSN